MSGRINKKELKLDAIICDMGGSLINYSNEPFRSSWDALAPALPDFRQLKEILPI